MILDELKIIIKDLETILSKDSRFKKEMYFKNQVKIIYGTKKINNVLIPMMINNIESSKSKISASCPKCETHTCPQPTSCPKCETNINLGNYERGILKESNEMTKLYLGLSNTSSEEEDLTELYKNPELAKEPIDDQVQLLKDIDKKFKKLTDIELKERIKKFQIK